MLEYLRSRDKSTGLAKELEEKRYEIAAETAFGSRPGCGRNFEKTQERIKIALGRMLSEGKISDKGLEDIYRTLDKVGLKARRGEYDFKSRPSATDGKVGIYKEFMKWFIENVYEEDEKFIERNRGVEEGEQELS